MSEARGEGPPASIRLWTVEDLPDVRRIGWETWKATYGPFIPEADLKAYHDEHYSEEALRKRFPLPATRGYMGLVGNAPAGYMIMSCDEREKRCNVSSIYIRPSCQGRGLGSMLMGEAFRFAREAGFDRVWLGVMSQNAPTIAWYRSLGFTFVEEEPFTMGRTTVLHYIGYRLTSSDLPNQTPAAHGSA
ncbi:MAG TPA: GNAT family N-acetyltransferase [Bacteroidota bacterium]|nr:GNAT family N-acetyltransferase [Bacteroidota bacterium]